MTLTYSLVFFVNLKIFVFWCAYTNFIKCNYWYISILAHNFIVLFIFLFFIFFVSCLIYCGLFEYV